MENQSDTCVYVDNSVDFKGFLRKKAKINDRLVHFSFREKYAKHKFSTEVVNEKEKRICGLMKVYFIRFIR